MFRFAIDDEGATLRLIEGISAVRSRLLKVPYGEQGLLISRALYSEVGGYAALPVLEDLDLVRKLGRKRITHLRARAVTSPARLQREGYVKRALRNSACLTLFMLRAARRAHCAAFRRQNASWTSFGAAAAQQHALASVALNGALRAAA